MKLKHLSLFYVFIGLGFGLQQLLSFKRYLDASSEACLALLVGLMLSNALIYLAVCSAFAQKKKLRAFAILLLVLIGNIVFALGVDRSFVLSGDGYLGPLKIEFTYLQKASYLADGLLTLIFLPKALRYRFFIPVTVFYYLVLNLLLSGQILLYLIIIWSWITGKNVYLG